jgi:hypothetical protein
MCFLNIGGLKNKEGSKLEDLFFINKINKFDIVFLAEIHIGYESNIHRVGTFSLIKSSEFETLALKSPHKRILPHFLYSTVSFSSNYTCYTANGTSIVDYTLVSESILDQILYFNVNNFIPTISDCHCIIEWSMSAKCTTNIIADEVRLYIFGPLLTLCISFE